MQCAIKTDNPVIITDPDMLSQILNNLLANATEALARDTDGEVHVTVSDRDNGMMAVCVEDNGPGLDAAAMREAMQPFWTTKADGGGLGLYVVGNLVRELGGRLELEPSDRGGLCARIVINPRESE